MSLLKWLNQVSPFRGMPVDDKGSSSTVVTAPAETVNFYYDNSGTLTLDAGQAAGTIVIGRFTYDNIKNEFGDMEGKNGDTSLSFTCAAMTNEVGVQDGISPAFIESLDECSLSARMAAIGEKLTSQGDYFIDYANGVVYVNKATTATSMTSVTYKYKAGISGASAGSATAPTGSSSDPVYSLIQNPLSTFNRSLINESVTNETNDTQDRIVDVTGLNQVSITFLKTGGTDSVTLRLFLSDEDDGTAGSLARYKDVTIGAVPRDGTTAATTYTASVSLKLDVLGAKFLNVQTISDGGANDADYSLDVRGAY